MAVSKNKNLNQLKTLILTDTHDKARTLKKFLGRQYIVLSSDGFLRAFPKSQLAVDTDNNFDLKFITVRGKAPLLNELRKTALNARRIYAVTDPSPLGELIAFHYCKLFGINPASNFHITVDFFNKDNIKSSFNSAKPINLNLANASLYLRIINRLFRFKLKPILEHKIYRGTYINLPQAFILYAICNHSSIPNPNSNSTLSWKTLINLASANLNFNPGLTSFTARQLYEGLAFNDSFSGLISFFESDNISSIDCKIDSLKPFLTSNQFKLFNLIHNFNQFLPSTNSCDSTLLNLFPDNLINSYPFAISSLLKRNFISLSNNNYIPSDLGKKVFAVLNDFFKPILTSDFINNIDYNFSSILNGKLDLNSAVNAFYQPIAHQLDAAYEVLGSNLSPNEQPLVESDQTCEICGSKMLIRKSRFGSFLACSNYPDCKFTSPYYQPTDFKCPVCSKPLFIRNLSKGRKFFFCKDCNFSSWDEPQHSTCNICNSQLFIHRFKDRSPMLYCGNKDCSSRQNHPINKILERIQNKYSSKKESSK